MDRDYERVAIRLGSHYLVSRIEKGISELRVTELVQVIVYFLVTAAFKFLVLLFSKSLMHCSPQFQIHIETF